MSKFLPTKLYTTSAKKVESSELEISDPEIAEGELAIQGAKVVEGELPIQCAKEAKNLPKYTDTACDHP